MRRLRALVAAAALGWSGVTTAHPVAALAVPFVPDDPGLTQRAGGWAAAQWNFAGPMGVRAPEAWGNLIAAGAPGGRGVTVAVLDTGIASTDRPPWRRSPDLRGTRFVRGVDLVDGKLPAADPSGHGTHVASTIAESTDNGYGMTGLAYGVRLMPVRILDAYGNGDASRVARGLRFAISHGARVVNLSLHFDLATRAAEIGSVLTALREAEQAGVVVVAAVGNDGAERIALPARVSTVMAVGATTEHGCVARYSNVGDGIDLVAPGGGDDAPLGDDDPGCRPAGRPGRNVMQVTLRESASFATRTSKSRARFGVGALAGTSMAAPHVAAAAALVIASGVLGRHPTAAAVRAHLESTSRDLGAPGPDQRYGAGLLDAAAATAVGAQ